MTFNFREGFHVQMKKMNIFKELSIMREHSFDMLIFFVTGVCNAKCTHCFYWENLGSAHIGLSLENIDKLAKSMPPFRTLLLSGGEPTLRSDLPKLIEIFRINNHIQSVSIPTNGLLPMRIKSLAQQIADIDPQLSVSFNVSIDGFSEVHDKIRGVPGNFNSAINTLQELRQIAQRYPNFRVYLNTVICADNYTQVLSFAEFIKSEELVDGHFFEIIRGDPPEVRIKAVPPEPLKKIYKALVPIQEGYLVQDVKRKRSGLIRLWRQVADIGNLINHYHHQWRVHALDKKWDFSCVAGEGIGVIDYNGQLRVCELRDDHVDLAAYNYDFSHAWESDIIRLEADVAKSHTCDCTHTCFINTSMRQDFSARFWDAIWLYFLYKIGKQW